MCNIVGYVGDRQAAPILIDMIRRSAIYDGGYSTGIATIHEGKIYWRKMAKGIEEFVNETDAMELPGTVGFIHSRPANNFAEYAHPFISKNEKLACCLNGTCSIDEFASLRNRSADFAALKGYSFRSARFAERDAYPQLSTGEYVAEGELIVYLTEIYMNEGMCFEQAFAKAVTSTFSDAVTLLLNADEPDSIFVDRITRPMTVLLGENETFIATTAFAFPEDKKGEIVSLPKLHVCAVTKNGFTVSPYKAQGAEVPDITPDVYHKGYERIVDMLKGKKDEPLTYDDVEVPFWKHMPDLWPGAQYTQFAPLVYEILWQLHREGRLRQTVKPKKNAYGQRNLSFMYLD